jgi:cyclic-di-AMP phosphodiesterase PgpH
VGLVGNQVDELHRSATRFERFRGWVEGLPKARLSFALVLLSWASLTLLIVLRDDEMTVSGAGRASQRPR